MNKQLATKRTNKQANKKFILVYVFKQYNFNGYCIKTYTVMMLMMMMMIMMMMMMIMMIMMMMMMAMTTSIPPTTQKPTRQ